MEENKNIRQVAEELLLRKVGKLALAGVKWKSLSERKDKIIDSMIEFSQTQKQQSDELIKELTNLQTKLLSLYTATDRPSTRIVLESKSLIEKANEYLTNN